MSGIKSSDVLYSDNGEGSERKQKRKQARSSIPLESDDMEVKNQLAHIRKELLQLQQINVGSIKIIKEITEQLKIDDKMTVIEKSLDSLDERVSKIEELMTNTIPDLQSKIDSIRVLLEQTHESESGRAPESTQTPEPEKVTNQVPLIQEDLPLNGSRYIARNDLINLTNEQIMKYGLNLSKSMKAFKKSHMGIDQDITDSVKDEYQVMKDNLNTINEYIRERKKAR